MKASKTWTPTLTTPAGGAPAGYALQQGVWARNSKLVVLGGRIALNGLGSLPAGQGLILQGLPLPVAQTSYQQGGFTVGYFANAITPMPWVAGYAEAGYNGFVMTRGLLGTGSIGGITMENIAATFDVIFGAWYQTAV